MFRSLLLVVSITIASSNPAHNEPSEPDLQTGCSKACPEPGNPSKLPSEKTYFLNFIAKANWYQALQLCHSMNLKFATVSNKLEYDKLIQLIKEANLGRASFWLSGSNLGLEDKYVWASYGLPVNYTNWFIGEPSHTFHDGEVEHCIEISSRFAYQMNDETCSLKNYYICEY